MKTNLHKYLDDTGTEPIPEDNANMVILIGLIIYQMVKKDGKWAWLSEIETTKRIETRIQILRDYGNLKTGYIMSRTHKVTLMEELHGHWYDVSDSQLVAEYMYNIIDERSADIYDYYKKAFERT